MPLLHRHRDRLAIAPTGAWSRLAACVAVVALFAQLALSVHAFLAQAGLVAGDDLCSVAGTQPNSMDGPGNAEGQPAAVAVHCPICTAAPGSFAAPPPAVVLALPVSPAAEASRPVIAFDIVPPPYLGGPPSRAPPAFA